MDAPAQFRLVKLLPVVRLACLRLCVLPICSSRWGTVRSCAHQTRDELSFPKQHVGSRRLLVPGSCIARGGPD